MKLSGTGDLGFPAWLEEGPHFEGGKTFALALSGFDLGQGRAPLEDPGWLKGGGLRPGLRPPLPNGWVRSGGMVRLEGR